VSQNPQRIDDVTREFLDDVARLMEEKGINQAELAGRLNVSPAQVSKILSGRANLTVSTLSRVSKALDASMWLRLAVEDEEAAAGQDAGEAASAREADQIEMLEPSDQDLEAAASELIDKLPPEAVARISKRCEKGERKRPGRPKGSGLIPDESRLERMADLLVAKGARSERQAAELIAEEDPGHSKKSTIRRLRRKFAEGREQLLAAALERLRQQRGAQGETVSRDSRPRRVDRSPVGARTPSSPPAALRDQTPGFLAGLQRDFQIDREIIDQLRTPYMLEEIAQLTSLRENIPLTTSVLADTALFENPATDLTRVDSYFARVSRVDDSIARGARTSTPLHRATRVINENLAATDLSSRVLTTKDLGYDRALSDDITGHKAMMRELDTCGQIDRKMKRLMYPFRED